MYFNPVYVVLWYMNKATDITDRVFGKLTARRREETPRGGRTRWVCSCLCGQTTTVDYGNLTSGGTTSCGCGKLKLNDLTHRRFGHLFVVCRKFPSRDAKGHYRTLWWVRCDCGVEKTMRAFTVLESKSCGCRLGAVYAALPDGESLKHHLLSRFKAGAKRRNLMWSLDTAAFEALVKSPCHYCGAGLSMTLTKPLLRGSFTHNSIDRVENSKGYVYDNVVPCCKFCQYAKRDMSYDDFIAHLLRAGEFQRKRSTESAVGRGEESNDGIPESNL